MTIAYLSECNEYSERVIGVMGQRVSREGYLLIDAYDFGKGTRRTFRADRVCAVFAAPLPAQTTLVPPGRSDAAFAAYLLATLGPVGAADVLYEEAMRDLTRTTLAGRAAYATEGAA